MTLEKTLLLVSVPRKNTGREDNKYLKARVAYIACHHSTAWFAVGESFAIFSARLREYSDFERIATRDCVTAACANYVHQRDNWAPTYLVSKRLVRIRRCLLNCHIWVTCIYIICILFSFELSHMGYLYIYICILFSFKRQSYISVGHKR